MSEARTDAGPTRDVLAGLLLSAHLAVPDDLPALIVVHARALDAFDAALYLADYDQRLLVPVPHRDGSAREAVNIDATVAGRCFRTVEVQDTPTDDGGRRVWAPVLDGTERLGVLELNFGPGRGEGSDEAVRAFAGLVAELVMTKSVYGDFFEFARRQQPMSVAAELAWRLLPPLTFATERVAISAAVMPTYDLGGDCFDYGVDADTLRFAVFDAMGHGLPAGLLATVAMAAYRNSRRRRLDLVATAVAIDEAVFEQFGSERFVTAVLAELDLASGRLRWTVHGHPPPLLLRRGRNVKTLDGNTGLPLGLSQYGPVAEEFLEPGDEVLLYTDGVVEARSSTGEFFGDERLTDLASRASLSGLPPPEKMRRLLHAILDHQAGDLQDDATVVLVEWHGDGGDRLQL